MKNLILINKWNYNIYEIDIENNDTLYPVYYKFGYPNGFTPISAKSRRKHELTLVNGSSDIDIKMKASLNDILSEYRPIDNVPFSLALYFIKTLTYHNAKIKLRSWSDNEFVVYQKGYPEGITCNKNTSEAWGIKEGSKFICNPYLQKQNKDMTHTMWIPSTDELLADDWQIIL